MCVCVCVCARARSVVSDSATPWTVASQASLSMEFSWPKYWSQLPFPTPGEFSQPGNQTCSFPVSCTGRRILYHRVTWKAHCQQYCNAYLKIAKTVDLKSTHHEKKNNCVVMVVMQIYIYTHTYVSLYK